MFIFSYSEKLPGPTVLQSDTFPFLTGRLLLGHVVISNMKANRIHLISDDKRLLKVCLVYVLF